MVKKKGGDTDLISVIAGIIIGMMNTAWTSVLVTSLFWGWAAYGYGRIVGYYKFGSKRFTVDYLMEFIIAALVGSITFFVKGLVVKDALFPF